MRTARVGDAAAAAVREILAWDWTNLGLVAAFLLCLPLPGGWPGVLAWLSGLTQTTDAIRYEQAIRAAAIKSPDSAQVLATIAPDQTETDIVKIGFVPMQGDAVTISSSRLRRNCRSGARVRPTHKLPFSRFWACLPSQCRDPLHG